MKVAFSLPLWRADGSAPNVGEIMSIARTIENAGFGGIWINDTIGRESPSPDPLQWLVAAAAATKSVDLGTAVYIVPLRNPVELAHRVLTTHVLTEGRFILGVGTGSNQTDFDAVGLDWSQRFKLLKENLDVIRRLCRGERVGDAKLEAWPNALPGPPIMIGAWTSERWIRRAATEFDGWLASGGGPGGTTFKDMKEGLKRFRDMGGKRAIVATVSVDLSEELPREKLTDETRFTLRCHPDDALERIRIAEEMGFDDVLLKKNVLSEMEVVELGRLLGLKQSTQTDEPLNRTL